MPRPLVVAATLFVLTLAVPEALGQQYTSYTVKQGDTLYRIARNHFVTVESLRKLNDIEQDHIEAGQTLWIDGRPESADVEPADSVATPVVSDFDSVSIDSVTEAGSVTDSMDNESLLVSVDIEMDSVAASIGDSLASEVQDDSTNLPLLSEMAVQAEAEAEAEATGATELIPHVVLDGETMFSIAARYGADTDSLSAHNPDHDTFLAAGDTIMVPWAGRLGEHRVRAGETLFRISREYGTSVHHIKTLNNLVDDTIKTGMALVVPVRPEGFVEVQNSESRVLDHGTVRVYPEIFEGRLMANGRSYIADRYTVSHGTIALGTFVVVVDPESGNQTFAEVTDRLPPGSDVVMEVSRAVADVLKLVDEEAIVEVRSAN